MRIALLTDLDMYIEMIFQAILRLCLKEKWSLDSVPRAQKRLAF